MWKLRMCVFAVTGLCALATSAAALAASSGDTNPGDVWVDTLGQAAGPRHEMDPHLACPDINHTDIALWGSGLADSSGRFSIEGWAPSGSSARAEWARSPTSSPSIACG